MEILVYRFDSAPNPARQPSAICGVVSSGNLEVLIKPTEASHECQLEVRTSARGFGDIWRAVLSTFAITHAVGGLHININDMGATPAVVTLRLSQALAEFEGAQP